MIDKESTSEIIEDTVFDKQLKKLVKLHKNDILVKSERYYVKSEFKLAEQNILTNYPKACLNADQEALALLGNIEHKLGKSDLAKEYFKKALSIPGRHVVYVKDCLGVCYYFLKDYRKACVYFGEATNQEIKNITYHLHYAYATEKRIEEVKEGLTTMKDKNEKTKLNEELIILKEQVKEEYSQILRINSDHYETLLNFGVYEAREGHLEEAEKLFNQALKIKEGDFTLFFNMGNIQLKWQKIKNAIDFYEKAINIIGIENTTVKILVPYMVALCKIDEWPKVEKVTRRILKLDKKNMKALAMFTRSLRENRKYEDLEAIYEKIRKKVSDVESKVGKSNNNSNSKLPDCFKKINKKLKEKMLEVNHLKKFHEENIQNVYNDNNNNGFLDENTSKTNINNNNDISNSNSNNTSNNKYLNNKLRNVDNTNTNANDDDNSINMNTVIALGYTGKAAEDFINKINKDPTNIESIFGKAMVYFKEEKFTKAEKTFEQILNINKKYNTQIIYERLGDIALKHYNNTAKALQLYHKSLKIQPNEILYIKIGRCYEMEGKFKKALHEYKNSNEINPNLVWSTFHIGCVLAKMKKPEALDYLRSAYEKEKENVDILSHYADELVKSEPKENIQLGIEILERAKEFYIGNVEILCSLAIGYEKMNRIDDAISLLEQANNYPAFFNNEFRLYQLAYYYEKNKNYTKAVEYFKNVLVINNESVRSLLHLGIIFKTAKEYKKAFKCFRSILEIEPNNTVANYGLGRIYQIMNDHDDEAIEHYLHCVKTDPKNIKSYVQLGITYLKNKDYKNAEKYLLKAHQLDNNNILCLVALGNVYQEIKDFDKAETYLKNALQIDHNDVNALSSYGDVLFSTKKYDEAIKKYEKALKFSEIAEVHFNLGHCYYLIEQFDYAVSHYINALKIKKNTRHDYYYYLGCALLANGRLRDAVKCFKGAIKLNKNISVYYYNLANAYYLFKKYVKGIKQLERCLQVENANTAKGKGSGVNIRDVNLLMFKCYFAMPKLNEDKCDKILKTLLKDEPKNIEVLDYVACLQEKTNKVNEAIATYEKIIQIDSQNQNAISALERLKQQ